MSQEIIPVAPFQFLLTEEGVEFSCKERGKVLNSHKKSFKYKEIRPDFGPFPEAGNTYQSTV
jgi:hypothetical protein